MKESGVVFKEKCPATFSEDFGELSVTEEINKYCDRLDIIPTSRETHSIAKKKIKCVSFGVFLNKWHESLCVKHGIDRNFASENVKNKYILFIEEKK